MKILFSLLACISLLSCTSKGSSDSTVILNDEWVVESFNGSKISIDPSTDGIEIPSLEICLADMQYHGSDGCNRFTGEIFELDEENIRFGMAAGTRKMCRNMEIPDLFNTLLPEVRAYKQIDLTLLFFNGEGEEIMKLNKFD